MCGDDPACKSSTIPSASEGLLAALRVPVLAPGSVQELLDLGRHAIACSRASGLWAALKVVTAVADSTAIAEVGIDRVSPVMPSLELDGKPYEHRPSAHLLAPDSLGMERTLTEVRLPLAKLYARLNALNVITHAGAEARLGVIVAGGAYQDLLQALRDLDVDAERQVRILKIGMLYPLDEEIVRSFAEGLEEIVVVEEKGPFLEGAVKVALYGGRSAPRVVGERDEEGIPLVPPTGPLETDGIARAIGVRMLMFEELPGVRARLDQLDAIAARPVASLGAARTPFFCSGCPHNTSTVADDDAIVGAGIGCHTMVMLAPNGHGRVEGLTQMGGEGAQWIGVAPFVEERHYVQNLGDGTFHHSGSLAVRAAVAAGLNVTYKLLYNDTVAMTGGQAVEGQLSVSDVARSLAAEGVRRIVITTDDTSRYKDAELPLNTEVRRRSQLAAAQRELARIEGVTVLIHDQACAAELRRARKRGKAPEPPQQVLINERVCEGCGDCGEKSGCLSVEPVETEFGRKTRIHQASCNKDFSCLEGDCPSFLTVIAPTKQPQREPPALDVELPEPELQVSAEDARIRMIGIGGTGVVTVSQVLGVAALLDGRQAHGLDQTGLSQKAGPVVSDMRLTRTNGSGGGTPPAGAVDVILGFDLLGSAMAKNLRVADPGRTLAVVSRSIVPTGQMVVDKGAATPNVEAAIEAIDHVTRAEQNVHLDAQVISEALFGDHMPANMLVLGAAWQAGAIPLSREALHEALRLNGAAVERNISAFEWGRAVVAAPEAVSEVVSGEATPVVGVSPLVDRVTRSEGELRRLLAIRVDDLRAWGGRRVAERYVEAVARVRALEEERAPGETRVTEAYARGLHKLLAYKDEYEVARLHLAELRALPKKTKVTFHLHPPLLRALGLRRKLRLGRWFVPALWLLARARGLRGTPLDPFGHAHVRRVERRLPGEHGTVDRALEALSPQTASTVVEIAELPEMVRGYEGIKLAAVARFHERAAELSRRLEGARGPALSQSSLGAALAWDLNTTPLRLLPVRSAMRPPIQSRHLSERASASSRSIRRLRSPR